jgi:hypothetical protein
MKRALALALVACGGDGGKESGEEACSGAPPESYAAELSWASAPMAGEANELSVAIRDQEGCPIEDLQQSHERMLHVLLVSEDLESFQHLHHEDYAEITADDLRSSTFRIPVTLPLAGTTLVAMDYAHRDAYLQSTALVQVEGSPAAGSPSEELNLEATDRDVVASLAWDVAPMAGLEAAFTLTLATTEGEPVTDIVQWLGADGHVAVVRADLGEVSHTHAWVPGMENMGPSMEMPPTYPGPTLPFHPYMSGPGLHRMWVQLARAGAPDEPYVFPFTFEVSP